MILKNSYALVVGITQYENVTPLPRVSDAERIEQTLIDPTLCGYSGDAVRCLSDSKATLGALREGMEWLESVTDTDSTVFIYFSGHGGRIEDGKFAGEYLLTVDSSFADNCTLADTSMSGEEFGDRLRNMQARKVFVVFDCCHAGGIGSPKSPVGVALKAGVSDQWYSSLSKGTGRVIMASCRPTEYSYILDGRPLSVFTEHLIDGLSGKARSYNGLIKVFDLFDYVQPKVTADHPRQHPIFRSETETSFPVSLNRGGEKSASKSDEQGFEYDAYISYVDTDPDSEWVWEKLVPMLEEARLRIAVSGDVEAPGVSRVSATEQAIRLSKRTILVLSQQYLTDYFSEFQNTLAQQMGIDEGTYRLLPIQIAEVGEIPNRLSQLVTLRMNHSSKNRVRREWDRLLKALQGPLPSR
ncbi:MAG: caspase family protein [Planctomycetota bacterium]